MSAANDDDAAATAFPGVVLHAGDFEAFLCSRKIGGGQAATSEPPPKRRRRRRRPSGGKAHSDLGPSPRRRSSRSSAGDGSARKEQRPARGRRRLVVSSLAQHGGGDMDAVESAAVLSDGAVLVQVRSVVLEMDVLVKLLAGGGRPVDLRSQAAAVSAHLHQIAQHVAARFDLPAYLVYVRDLDSDVLRTAVAAELPAADKIRHLGHIQTQLASTLSRVLHLHKPV